ncbi:MAG: hypothetical protein IT379_26590 [Deltaproteobacteria bacterium]|nr:hypothetical protein [Deltaproteobacteria bacterium]
MQVAHGGIVVVALFLVVFGVLPAAGISIVAGLKLLPRRLHPVLIGGECAAAALVVGVMTIVPFGDDVPWLHLIALGTVGLPLAGLLWLDGKQREAMIALVASVVGVPAATLGLLFLLTM